MERKIGSIIKGYNRWIKTNLSLDPAIVGHQYSTFENYVFFPTTHVVYARSLDRYVQVTEELYTDLLHDEDNDKHFYLRINKIVGSYSIGISSAEGRGTELIDLINLSDQSTPETDTVKAEQNQALYDAIDQLTDSQKAVIIGIFFRGMKEAELATQLGRSQSTIHHHRERALKTLACILSDMELEMDYER